ncbi:MAG: CoB--CoM heterodisulfide reductase iron-sulfur subunit B family protein [Bacteroidales bacterium]|nr:CoB--CoM heterodisulfide reductase iron-sulfur subunit B family protein [Bacteroidales bacterium]
MKVGFYPGCSLEGSSKEYSKSLFAVSEKCGITLEEIKDWSCCGASAAHSLNHDLSIALPARTLALAEKQGLSEIVIPCAACYGRLAASQQAILNDKAILEKTEKYIDMAFTGNVQLLTVFEFLQKYIFPVADQYIVDKLNQKTACYYGCLLARPKDLTKLERPENPMEMEKVMEKAGATPIDWAFKTECCGAGFSMSRTDLVAKLSGRILEDAAERGADSIIVACPMCHSNLDLRRPEIKKQLKKDINIPVLFITQALGLSMGISAKELGLDKHFVPTGKAVSCIVKKEA